MFKSYSLIQKCDSNAAYLDKHIDLNENRLNREDSNVERISSNFNHEEKVNIDLKLTVDMKLSLSPAVNIPTESKAEILILDENLSVPDINNNCEKHIIEKKLENSNVDDKIQLCDSNQGVDCVSSNDKRSSNALTELKNDQRVNYEIFKFSDTMNNYERNSMERNKITLTLMVKIKHMITTKMSREDCNFNVEKGFFSLKTTSVT